MSEHGPRCIKGRLLSFSDCPADLNDTQAFDYEQDGLLAIENGRISWRGPAAERPQSYRDWPLVDYGDALILPGFIDTHTHYPQMEVIGGYSPALLDWLETYTFPSEARFADPEFATLMADQFLNELVAHGVTSAAVYATSHPNSADAFFTAAARRQMRMIAGKVLMDRGAPPALCDTPQRAYDESKALIERWHGHDRLAYAITPRFAITSTPEQLKVVQSLVQEHPDCYVQTHLSENRDEITQTLALFPSARDYTDVYESYDLLGPKSLFGHCVHLQKREISALRASRSVAVFCPSSNLFLGSGLFDYASLKAASLRLALASDIGAGTSYSMLATAADAYKVCQLQAYSLNPLESFYQLTLGNARALSLEDKIGTLEIGTEADFIVLSGDQTSALRARLRSVQSLAEELFVLQTLGDDRCIVETYVAGIPRKTGSNGGAA